MFRQLFERSADAIFLFDTRREVFVDCNQAAVEMMRARSKEQLLMVHPAELSPEFQPDGRSSREKTPEVTGIAVEKGSHRFEWRAKRFDGTELPVEVLLTPVESGEYPLMATVCRDITERKAAEAALRESEARFRKLVAERTAELGTSEARFRALVEHAPEAIVVFDGDSGRFHFGNEHACRLYGVPMEKLTTLTPADVSPEFQPGGHESIKLAREKMDEALAGGTPVFEWTHQRPDGRLIPTEVRLLRLPAEGQNLIRASIIDNTEHKRAQRALRESEEKFRALFEGSSQGVVLHDEERILDANPAAVRIMGCQSATELIGKHPAETSPPLQPNGESSADLARKNIEECLAEGSARFEWMSRSPHGKEIPLEVTLTRIQWSGRQVIQALITDITERKQAEEALREVNRMLSQENEQRMRAEESLNERVRTSTLSTEVALALNGATELQAMLQQCADLAIRHLDVAFMRIWTFNENSQALEVQGSAGRCMHLEGPHSRVSVGEHRISLIARDKKPYFTNNVQMDPRLCEGEWAGREGMVAFAGYPLLLENRLLGVMALFSRQPFTEDVLKGLGPVADSIALGIERKRAQTALSESEARFSVAFQASPVFIGIARLNDGRFELVNDAFVSWSGYSREQILGRSTSELVVWERQEDREAFWADLRRTGSIGVRECRFRNRNGRRSTMLLSAEVIQLNRVPHILSMALDITERKQTEADLRASEARLRESEGRFSVAFHSSPIITGILRASDARFVLVNDAALNWLGYAREEVIGHTGAELNIWENPAERLRFWEEAKQFGFIRERECRLRNRRQTISTMLASGAMIEINGEDHLLMMLVDISQRKQAEAELQKTLTREIELSQLKSNFVSMVSHEFRTPLGIIQSSAELLRDFYERMPLPERNEQLESIARNTRRMAGMMEEILVFSRLDAGKMEFQPAAVDLNVFCRRMVDEVLSATNSRCPIELSLAAVPPEAKADESLLGHTLTNLLSNAVKYSEPGALVRFEVERDGDDAICTVRDRGIGIAEQDQFNLFQAFHRGGNVGTRPGTGLGLLMVKRCVELHRGQVNLVSKLGEGTTVTVRLPVFGNG